MATILERVQLKNFLSHRNTQIEFKKGVTVIVGENGAGKTSIIDAVLFALIGSGRGETPRGNLANLISHGAPACEVELYFNIDGDNYKIWRKLIRRKKGSPVHNALMTKNGRIIANSPDSVTSMVEEIIGLRRDLLGRLILVRQGELLSLLTMLSSRGEKEKLEFIDSILALDIFKKAEEKLGEYYLEGIFKSLALTKKYSIKQTALDDVAKDRASLEERKKNIEEEIKAKREEEKRYLAEIKTIEKKLAVSREERAKLQEELEKLKKFKDEYEDTRAKLEQILKEKKSVLAKIREAERLLEELKDLEPWAKVHDLIIEAINLDRQARSIEEDINNLNDTRNLLSRLSHLHKIRERYEFLEKRLQELEKCVKKSVELEAILREKERDLAVLERSLTNKMSEIESIGLKIDGEKPLELGKILTDILEEKKTLVAGKREALEKLEDEKRSISARISEITERIKKLKEAEAECPLCGQALTIEHKTNVMKKLRKELELSKNKLASIEQRIDKERQEIELLEQIINLVQDALGIIDEYRELVGELEKTREEQEGIRHCIKEYEALRNEQNSLSKDYYLYEHLKSEVGKRLRKLSINPTGIDDEKGVEKHLREIMSIAEVRQEDYNKIQSLIEEVLETINKELGRNYSLSELIEYYNGFIKSKLDNLRRLKEAKTLLREYHERLKAYQVEEKILMEKLESIRKAGYSEERYKELEELLEKVTDTIKNLEIELERLKSRLENTREELQKLQKEIDNVKHDISVLDDIEWRLRVLLFIRRNILGREGAPRIWRRLVTRRLEQEITRFLNLFELTYSEVRIDPDSFNIVLFSPDGTAIGVQQLSGGEQVALALALLLAIYSAFGSDRLGVLFLDEPTIHLDTDRRRKLVDMFKEFKGGRAVPQLIIVTHDQEVENAADHVYEVVKENGWSKVKLVQGVAW